MTTTKQESILNYIASASALFIAALLSLSAFSLIFQ